MAPFLPPRLLRGRHVQSILGNVGLRRWLVRTAAHGLLAASRNEIVDCGAGVRLLCQHAPPQSDRMRRIAVIIHGWEGSADSTYLLSAATKLLQQAFPGERLYLCGFSLGGNFALRIAAQAAEEGLEINGVVAICPVLDPACTMAALDNGALIYRRYFLNKWRRSLEKKKAAFPHRYNFSRLERFDTLTEMTDYFVRYYTEYPDLHEYLRGYALTDGRLQHLRTPSRMLLAKDDPVIPIADIDRVVASDYLQVFQSRYGGHCGFVGGYDLRGWADRYIVDSFANPQFASDSATIRTRG